MTPTDQPTCPTLPPNQRGGAMKGQPPEVRFWVLVDKRGPDECWEWLGNTQRGYGRFLVGGKTVKVHRWAYTQLVGAIPDGLTLDHLCRNRACVNPAHLEPVTSGVNVLRGVGPPAENGRKTHCIHGHPLTGENLYVQPSNGYRYCRICKRRYKREARSRARG